MFAAILNNKQDKKIWDKVYTITTESTPLPRSLPLLSQTPYLYTTSSLVNSSKRRKYVDRVLKEELDLIYIGVPGFFEAYFRGIDGLDNIYATVFKKCKEEDVPYFREGDNWRDWPNISKEKDILAWLTYLVDIFYNFATEEGVLNLDHYRLLSQPNHPLEGSTAE